MTEHRISYTDVELSKGTAETKLWTAVLKRALDDVNHYPPESRLHQRALEWLSIAGDENEKGTLASVISFLTTSKDHQDTIIRQIQRLIYDKDKLNAYKEACLIVRVYRFKDRRKYDS
jgi:hypothetical protein